MTNLLTSRFPQPDKTRTVTQKNKYALILKLELAEFLEGFQASGNRGVELIAGEIHERSLTQLGAIGEFGGNLAGELVLGKLQSLKVGEFAKSRGNCSGQLVALEPKFLEGRHFSNLSWDSPGQGVVINLEFLQAGQVAHLLGNLTRKATGSDSDALEVLHVTDSGGDNTTSGDFAKEDSFKVVH